MEFENLLALIEAVSDSELTGLKYEENGMKLHLTKREDKVQAQSQMGAGAQAPVQITAQAAPTDTEGAFAPQAAALTAGEPAVPEAAKEGRIIESPLVGTFYSAPSEDAEVFVTVGDTVKKGQTLAIIEAMKLMNEIESEYDGTIAEVLVENGKPVEYGQPLFRIK